MLGFRYDGPREREVYWVDDYYAGLYESLKAAFPGKFIDMTSSSDDERRMIVQVSATNDPGTIYLYEAGKGLKELGRPWPQLTPDRLAETELVYYKARDGLTIPAFLTIPKRGQKPYPLVVMPHGGPWARDSLGFDYSMWRPFLADRGYACCSRSIAAQRVGARRCGAPATGSGARRCRTTRTTACAG